jgi:hypothetical protein
MKPKLILCLALVLSGGLAKFSDMKQVQKGISGWLVVLWCLGASSPTIFYFALTCVIQPRFGLPNHKWLSLTLLAGFLASACASTLMQLSLKKRIGLVLLAAMVIAIQFAAMVIYAVNHFPVPT